jgi:hypothetical protein
MTEIPARDFVPNQGRETVPHAGLKGERIKAKRAQLAHCAAPGKLRRSLFFR